MQRRRFLLAGLSAALAGGAFATACSSRNGFDGWGSLLPHDLSGDATTVLEARYASLTLAGKKLRLRTYNGKTYGPTIVTRPGRTLAIRVVNSLPANPKASLPRPGTAIPRIESGMEAMNDPMPSGRPKAASGSIDPMNNPHEFNTTNLHVHGIQTVPHLFAPVGTSDPSAEMLGIDPGKSLQYDFPIPKDHPAGLHWYHPHHHGSTDVQVSGGMAGLLVVRGDVDDVPEIAAARELFLVVQTLEVNPSATRRNVWEREPIAWRTPDNGGYTFTTNYTMVTTNGQPVVWIDKRNKIYTPLGVPQFQVRPGEVVRLRFLNGTNYLPLVLALPGFESWQIGFDGVNTLEPLKRDMSGTGVKLVTPANVFTAPIRQTMSGNRVEFLVRAPSRAGSYKLSSPQTKDLFGDVAAMDLAEFVVSGTPVKMSIPAKLPTPAREYPQIKAKDVVAYRKFVLEQGPRTDMLPGYGFTINGQLYRMDSSAFAPKVGTAEEWRVVNKTGDAHPFHLHTNSFQLIAVNDNPVSPFEVWDTFMVPPQYNGKNGSITIRMRFKEWYGKDVFHCHVISHEDTGMMMNFLMA